MNDIEVETHVQSDGTWVLTTKGLRRHARPEIEVAFVRDDELPEARALVEHVAQNVASGPLRGPCTVALRGAASGDPVVVRLKEYRAEPATLFGHALGVSERHVMRVVDLDRESARPDGALRAFRNRPRVAILSS